MGQILVYVVVIVIFAIIFTIINDNKKKIKNDLADRRMLFFKGHNLTHVDSTSNDFGTIAIDNDAKLFLYATNSNVKKIKYEDITGFEILKDGETSNKINRTGAVIGGALAGGIGAVVGSQMNKKSKTVVKKIEFILFTKDINNPTVKFIMYNGNNMKDSTGFDITDKFEVRKPIIEKWEGIFKIIVSD
jgi:hypothetical protein